MTTRDSIELRRGSWRLAIQLAVLLLVLFTILGGLLYAIVSASQSDSIRRTLLNSSMVDSPRDAPVGVFVIILDRLGTEVPPNLPPGLPDLDALQSVAHTGQALQQTKTISGHSYAIFTSADHARVTQVAVDLHESQEERQRLVAALLIAGGAAAIIAGLSAAWMARRAMRPLAEALALQRRFVMDASHELRTPLTLLSTRAQLVRRRLSPGSTSPPVEDIAHGLDEIVQDSRVLSEILEDLLIAADPREVAEKDHLDLALLADDAVSAARAEAESRGIWLHRTASPSPVIVTAARVSMQRLFTALIANALDHAKSEVVVEVTLQGREATIRVIDDGTGFAQGMDERAFERFASARPATHDGDRPRHYGLGLALVSEVAARHGGGVSVEPRLPGHGAVVVVRIPTHP